MYLKNLLGAMIAAYPLGGMIAAIMMSNYVQTIGRSKAIIIALVIEVIKIKNIRF
jgi:hypothetical protein